MKFLAEDNRLIITLEGLEMFWAVKHRLVLRRDNIIDLEWQPSFQFDKRLWRFGGADIPSALWAGRFAGAGKRYFLYIKGPRGLTWSPRSQVLPNILRIKLQGNFYQEILLTCEPDIGAGLINWWKGTTYPQ